MFFFFSDCRFNWQLAAHLCCNVSKIKSINTVKRMKKAIYFPMNTAHYSSVKSLNIRMKFDLAGYALYVMTLQKLGEAKDRTIPLSAIPALAFDLRCDKDTLHSIIELGFDIDGKNFYSTELNESLAYYDSKYNNCSNGGKAAQAKLSPEEKSERGKKLADLKKQKAQARRDESLEKEIEEQVQTQNFEDNQNGTLSKVTLEVDNQNNGLERTTPLSDTDNRNINRNRDIKEIEKEKNRKEIEIETHPTGLGSVSLSLLATPPSGRSLRRYTLQQGLEKVRAMQVFLLITPQQKI